MAGETDFPAAWPAGSSTVEITRALFVSFPWLFSSVRIERLAFPPSIFAATKGSPLLHMDGVRLHKPHVPVNPSALVEPSVARGGIDTHQQHVSAAGIGEVCHIEAEGIVSTAVAADVKAVEHNH